jgi:hAT family C-terminal dimerisation region
VNNKIYFLLLGHLIFAATEEISCSLQRINNHLGDALSAVNALISYFTRIKTDDNFKSFYAKLLNESKHYTDEPKLPRVRRRPARFIIEGTTTSENYQTCDEFYKKQYQHVIDNILNALDNRFKQTIFPVLCRVEDFLLAVANGSHATINNDPFVEIEDFIADAIDRERLKHECTMFADFCRTAIHDKQMGIVKITKISTIIDIMNEQPIGKTMFHQYNRLLHLYLTVPVTTATAERSFSVMNRMKTCYRSTMTQTRLNSAFLTHIYKEKMDSIDLNSICSTFVSRNEQRKRFFGTF